MHIEENVIRYVRKQTKWSRDTARHSLEAAAERGISPEEYVRFCCWEIPDSELEEVTALLGPLHERQKENEETFIRLAHRRTLRSEASLRKEIERFKELGIEPLEYIKKGYYYPHRTAFGKKLARDRERPLPKKGPFFKKIREVTGWSASRTALETAKAWIASGADHEDFFRFRMHECSAEEQATYLTREHFRKMSICLNGHYTRYLLNNKPAFNRVFSDHIRRRWFLNRRLSYSRFLKKIRGLDAILVKPIDSTHGKGIRHFDCSTPDKRALYDAVMGLPESIVEEYIVQHPDMAAFCSSSVNTLRVVTLDANGKCNILFALLRMGQQGAVVDNVHSGGIAAAVDVETGIICSDALDADGRLHTVHPSSKVPIKGAQIPNWDAVMAACQKCYNRIPGVRLIGWDIAITEHGAELIEGNPAPAFASIQALALQQGKGLRAEIFDAFFTGP